MTGNDRVRTFYFRDAILALAVIAVIGGIIAAAGGTSSTFEQSARGVTDACIDVYPPDDRPELSGPSNGGEFSWFPLGIECIYHNDSVETGRVLQGTLEPTGWLYGGLGVSAIGLLALGILRALGKQRRSETSS